MHKHTYLLPIALHLPRRGRGRRRAWGGGWRALRGGGHRNGWWDPIWDRGRGGDSGLRALFLWFARGGCDTGN
eukprot:1357136-Amorphochlora_amoeboformis.AAC.1